MTLSGVTYQWITLKKDKFFGFEDVWVQDHKVKMASREKMVVDCLDRPNLCGGIVEASKGLWNARNELDFPLLIRYAIRMKEGIVCKRLGFLLEFYKLGEKTLLTHLKTHLSTGVSLLDPNLPKSGKRSKEWHLQMNVRSEDLESWKNH